MSNSPLSVTISGNASGMAHPVVLVFGDLCADLVAVGQLSGRFTAAADPIDELTFRAPLRDRAGGTAFHFARAAAAASLRPIVVGSVGTDQSGQLIRHALTAAGLDHVIFEQPDHATGRVVLAYDDTGRRFMLTERDSANRYLPELGPALDAITGPIDLAWVSGISICDRSTATFAAVLTALEEVRRRGGRVLVDIVPHEFHEHFPSVGGLLEELGGVDGLVSEQASMRRLLRVGHPGESVGPEALEETARAVLETVPMTIVRQRVGDSYYQLAAARSQENLKVRRFDTYNDERMAGLGDRLACMALPELLAVGVGE